MESRRSCPHDLYQDLKHSGHNEILQNVLCILYHIDGLETRIFLTF